MDRIGGRLPSSRPDASCLRIVAAARQVPAIPAPASVPTASKWFGTELKGSATKSDRVGREVWRNHPVLTDMEG